MYLRKTRWEVSPINPHQINEEGNQGPQPTLRQGSTTWTYVYLGLGTGTFFRRLSNRSTGPKKEDSFEEVPLVKLLKFVDGHFIGGILKDINLDYFVRPIQ